MVTKRKQSGGFLKILHKKGYNFVMVISTKVRHKD